MQSLVTSRIMTFFGSFFAGNPSRPSFASVSGWDVHPKCRSYLFLVLDVGSHHKRDFVGVSFGHGVMVGSATTDAGPVDGKHVCLFFFPVPFWRDKIESYKITIRVTSLSQPFSKKFSGIKMVFKWRFDSSLDPGEVLIYTDSVDAMHGKT